MKLKKILGSTIVALGIFSSSVSASANSEILQPDKIKGIDGKPVIIKKVSDGILTISNAKNPEQLLSKLEKDERQKYAMEVEAALKAGGYAVGSGNEGSVTTLGAVECISQCSEAYRYGSKTQPNGNAEAYTSVGGYHWYWGRVNWTGVHGGVIGKWKGSGTAQFIKIDHTLKYSGWDISITWPVSFAPSGNTATYSGERADYTNSHMSQFSGASAYSYGSLTTLTHEGTALVRGSDGYDYRPIAVVSIN